MRNICYSRPTCSTQLLLTYVFQLVLGGPRFEKINHAFTTFRVIDITRHGMGIRLLFRIRHSPITTDKVGYCLQ